jgi:hypothetical protein
MDPRMNGRGLPDPDDYREEESRWKPHYANLSNARVKSGPRETIYPASPPSPTPQSLQLDQSISNSIIRELQTQISNLTSKMAVLERRLERAEEIDQIRALIHEFCLLHNVSDLRQGGPNRQALENLFIEDVVLDYPSVRHKGQAGAAAFVGDEIRRELNCRMLTSDMQIRLYESAPRKARVTATCIICLQSARSSDAAVESVSAFENRISSWIVTKQEHMVRIRWQIESFRL